MLEDRSTYIYLCILLVVFTLAILLFPTRRIFSYHPVESLLIFDNISVFGALYYAWLLVLVLLFYKVRSKRICLGTILILIAFVLVFMGFWSFKAYQNGGLLWHGATNAADVRTILRENRLPIPGTLMGYTGGHQAIHLLAGLLIKVTGFETLSAITFLIIFHASLFSILIYLLFVNLLDPVKAIIATLFFFQGNMVIQRMEIQFFPSTFSLPFVVLLFLLVIRMSTGLHIASKYLLTSLLLIATVMTHAINAIFLSTSLVGIYLMQKIRGEKSIGLPLSIVLLSAVIPTFWFMYSISDIFQLLVSLLLRMPSLKEPLPFESVFIVSEALTREGTPFWVNLIQFFWIFLIFGLGSLLALRDLIGILLHNRRIKVARTLEMGVLVGAIALTLIGLITSTGGEQYYRYLIYGSFVTVPVLIASLTASKPRRNTILASLMILFYVLSFPTFIAFNAHTPTNSTYFYEFSPSRVLTSSFGVGQGLTVITSQLVKGGLIVNFLPYANVRIEPDYHYIESEKGLWEQLGYLISEFDRSNDGKTVFIFTERIKLYYNYIFGISPQDPEWLSIRQRLLRSNQVYDNRGAQIYYP